MKLHDTLVSAFGLVYIVYSVAIGRESVWKFKTTLRYRHLYRFGICPIIGCIGNGVGSVDKGGIQHNGTNTRFGEGVLGILVVTYEVGRVSTFLAETPFIVWSIYTYIGGVGCKAHC